MRGIYGLSTYREIDIHALDGLPDISGRMRDKRAYLGTFGG
jgi:hypothetical protein